MKREIDIMQEALWLPLEIWQEILIRVGADQLFKCATVCKTWHTADLINKSVYRLWPSIMRGISPARLARMRNIASLSFYSVTHNYSDVFSSLVNLTHLEMRNMRDVGDHSLRQLTKLKTLLLGQTSVTINALLELTGLRKLTLTYLNNTISDTECSQLTQLSSLCLETNSLLQGSGICALTQLTTLDLFDGHVDYMDVTDDTIRGLTNLTKLVIEAPEVTNKGISCLTNLSKLKLRIASITNEAIDPLNLLTRLRVGNSSLITPESLKRKDSIRFSRTLF